MNGKKKQKRRRARPMLIEANGALLFAAAGLALLTFARIALPREWSALEAGVLWDALYGGVLIALGMRLSGRIRRSARENALRLRPPSIAQTILVIVATGAGVLFADDLTLLTGACMQRLGFDVSRQIAASEPAPGYLYAMRVLLSGLLPAFAAEWFFHGAQMAAWERRGTAYAMLTSSALCALLCGSAVLFPAKLVLALAAGAVMIGTGSIFMAMLMQTGILVASVAARQVQSMIGMAPARYGRLWAELGGKTGAGLLALETLLLGLVFLFLVRAVCCAQPGERIPWRPHPAQIKPMSAANVFVLAAAVVTGLAVLAADLMQMAGIF